MSEEEKIIIGTIGFGGLRGGKIEIKVEKGQEALVKSLEDFKLHIPDYQRPYAWKENQVEILLNDLKDVIESKKQSYLLGSLIFHQEEKEGGKLLNIVDGQQRLVTLALIYAELEQWEQKMEGDKKLWNRKMKGLEGGFLMNQKFPHSESQKNLQNNYIYIQKWFGRNEDEIDGFKDLLSKNVVEFVCIVTPNPDDAFIFFDSANSKGKKLEDYDLIKAYHLREIVAKNQNSLLPYYAKLFENMAKDGKYLSFFFDEILTPARLWLRDRSGLVAGDMRVYDEFCKEIPKSFARANRSSQDMGILTSFAGGVDFFLFLQRFDNLLKTLKTYAFYQDLEKIGGAGFGYTRNLYVMAVMIYLDKFPCGRSDYMIMLLARAVFEMRVCKASVYQSTARDYAKEVLPLVYFSEFEEELEHSLLAFIGEKDKEKREGEHDGGKKEYLRLVQGVQGESSPKYPYSEWKIPKHNIPQEGGKQ